MKKLILVLAVLAAVSAAQAVPTYFTPTDADLLSMDIKWVGPTTVVVGSLLAYSDPIEGGITYSANMYHAPLGTTGEAVVGIGTTGFDMSAYDGIQIAFKNTNNSDWTLNVWAKAVGGAIYDNGAVKTSPGDSLTITLDFLGSKDIESYGFEVMGNMNAGAATDDPSNPDAFHITASPVPVPGAFLLGGIGVACVGWVRRRKSL